MEVCPAGRVDCQCLCLSGILVSFQLPRHSPLRIALPHWQSSWDGQSGALSCSAKGQVDDPSQASQTVSSESLNPKEDRSGRNRCILAAMHTGDCSLPLPFWILGTVLAPFLSEPEHCTFFFDSYPPSKFLAFW